MCMCRSSPRQSQAPGAAGACAGLLGKATPRLRPPKGQARGKAWLPPTDRSPWLPEQGPGTGQRRLNSAGSVSGRAINKSVGGNGGMSQRREGEKVIFGGTHYPSPACHRAPEPSEDSCRRLSSSRSSSPITSCQEDDGGRPFWWEPRPQLGGLQPSPHPGDPQVHAAGARLDPSSTMGPGEGGLGHCTSLRTCTQLPLPSTTLGKLRIFGYITHTHTCSPINPRARSSPAEMSQLTAEHRCSYRLWSEARQCLICSQLQISPKRGLNLIKAELDSRLKSFGCSACQMSFT